MEIDLVELGAMHSKLPLTLRHGKLTARQPMAQAEVYRMIQRRAIAAGIETKISCHGFRATGITT